jgi:hypothetical protein
MKKYFFIVSCFLLFGCSSTKTATEWEESENKSFRTITHGVPAYQKTSVVYKQKGNEKFTVELDEPVAVSVADKEEKWGFFQFPNIYRSIDGNLAALWAMQTDHAESYGKDNHGFAVSKDGGKTWTAGSGPRPLGGGIELPNGDQIMNYTPAGIDTLTLKLPKSVGRTKSSFKTKRFVTYYKLDELPENLQGVYINRLAKGQNAWALEHNPLHDAKAVRYADEGLFPIVWWGEMRVNSEGKVATGIYPGYSVENGKVVDPCGVFFYQSSDNGKSWQITGRIPYEPDLVNDSNGGKREAWGFTEPAFEILPDGSYLCVLRTTDGMGNSPMYVSRSVDKGVTWTKPKVFTSAGVLPKMLQLDNGVTVLASGRPGMQLRFSKGTKGLEWTDPFEMMPFNSSVKDVSCGYPSLLITGPDRFLIVYSDFMHKNEKGEIRKAIKVREIVVSAK